MGRNGKKLVKWIKRNVFHIKKKPKASQDDDTEPMIAVDDTLGDDEVPELGITTAKAKRKTFCIKKKKPKATQDDDKVPEKADDETTELDNTTAKRRLFRIKKKPKATQDDDKVADDEATELNITTTKRRLFRIKKKSKATLDDDKVPEKAIDTQDDDKAPELDITTAKHGNVAFEVESRPATAMSRPATAMSRPRTAMSRPRTANRPPSARGKELGEQLDLKIKAVEENRQKHLDLQHQRLLLNKEKADKVRKRKHDLSRKLIRPPNVNFALALKKPQAEDVEELQPPAKDIEEPQKLPQAEDLEDFIMLPELQWAEDLIDQTAEEKEFEEIRKAYIEHIRPRTRRGTPPSHPRTSQCPVNMECIAEANENNDEVLTKDPTIPSAEGDIATEGQQEELYDDEEEMANMKSYIRWRDIREQGIASPAHSGMIQLDDLENDYNSLVASAPNYGDDKSVEAKIFCGEEEEEANEGNERATAPDQIPTSDETMCLSYERLQGAETSTGNVELEDGPDTQSTPVKTESVKRDQLNATPKPNMNCWIEKVEGDVVQLKVSEPKDVKKELSDVQINSMIRAPPTSICQAKKKATPISTTITVMPRKTDHGKQVKDKAAPVSIISNQRNYAKVKVIPVGTITADLGKVNGIPTGTTTADNKIEQVKNKAAPISNIVQVSTATSDKTDHGKQVKSKAALMTVADITTTTSVNTDQVKSKAAPMGIADITTTFTDLGKQVKSKAAPMTTTTDKTDHGKQVKNKAAPMTTTTDKTDHGNQIKSKAALMTIADIDQVKSKAVPMGIADITTTTFDVKTDQVKSKAAPMTTTTDKTDHGKQVKIKAAPMGIADITTTFIVKTDHGKQVKNKAAPMGIADITSAFDVKIDHGKQVKSKAAPMAIADITTTFDVKTDHSQKVKSKTVLISTIADQSDHGKQVEIKGIPVSTTTTTDETDHSKQVKSKAVPISTIADQSDHSKQIEIKGMPVSTTTTDKTEHDKQVKEMAVATSTTTDHGKLITTAAKQSNEKDEEKTAIASAQDGQAVPTDTTKQSEECKPKKSLKSVLCKTPRRFKQKKNQKKVHFNGCDEVILVEVLPDDCYVKIDPREWDENYVSDSDSDTSIDSTFQFFGVDELHPRSNRLRDLLRTVMEITSSDEAMYSAILTEPNESNSSSEFDFDAEPHVASKEKLESSESESEGSVYEYDSSEGSSSGGVYEDSEGISNFEESDSKTDGNPEISTIIGTSPLPEIIDNSRKIPGETVPKSSSGFISINLASPEDKPDEGLQFESGNANGNPNKIPRSYAHGKITEELSSASNDSLTDFFNQKVASGFGSFTPRPPPSRSPPKDTQQSFHQNRTHQKSCSETQNNLKMPNSLNFPIKPPSTDLFSLNNNSPCYTNIPPNYPSIADKGPSFTVRYPCPDGGLTILNPTSTYYEPPLRPAKKSFYKKASKYASETTEYEDIPEEIEPSSSLEIELKSQRRNSSESIPEEVESSSSLEIELKSESRYINHNTIPEEVESSSSLEFKLKTDPKEIVSSSSLEISKIELEARSGYETIPEEVETCSSLEIGKIEVSLQEKRRKKYNDNYCGSSESIPELLEGLSTDSSFADFESSESNKSSNSSSGGYFVPRPPTASSRPPPRNSFRRRRMSTARRVSHYPPPTPPPRARHLNTKVSAHAEGFTRTVPPNLDSSRNSIDSLEKTIHYKCEGGLTILQPDSSYHEPLRKQNKLMKQRDSRCPNVLPKIEERARKPSRLLPPIHNASVTGIPAPSDVRGRGTQWHDQ